jgi:peptide/nickel transport system permease protein
MSVSTASAGAAPRTLEFGPETLKKQRTLWGDAWVQFRRNKLALAGMFVLILLMFGVLIGPYVYTKDPKFIDFSVSDARPAPTHPFGTDDMGRDTLARNLYGGRISLAVGLVAMLLAMTVGTVVGLLSGFISWLDNPLMRFTDMMLALPQVPLLLVVILLFRDSLRAMFGPELGIFLLVVFVIGVLGWMPTARIVRGQVLSIKRKEFVEAAVNIGSRQGSIMFRHILPNVVSPIIVAATLGIANAILTESVLSFLGLGFPSDVPTWGRLLFEGKDFISSNPWVSLWPGLLISLTILSINFMGDGLRDALDPRQRQ